MTRVAVVGLGGMGGRMARRLLEAGHELTVWNRTSTRMEPLLELGAAPAASPADAARDAQVLITMVADPAALRAVTEGTEGVAAGASENLTVIEMSTVGPAAVSRLGAALPPGVGFLDAPVVGSLAEAEGGTLAIFVGGPDALVDRWRPLLEVLGTPHHVGPVGAGAAAKLVANSALVGVIGVLGEALALAAGLGLTLEASFDVLAATALAAQADRRRRAFESGDFPPRFPLSLARKDADLIAEAASTADIELRVTDAARSWLADAERHGLGDRDYAAVLAFITGRAAAPPEPERPTGR